MDVVAESEGFVQAISAREIGLAGVAMGAGRARKEDGVDPVAGITLNKSVGDPVGRGDILARLHGIDTDRVRGVAERVAKAFRTGPGEPAGPTLIRGRFATGSWSAVTG